MIDIDHFKRVNDTHGHPAGDVILRDIAGLLKKSVRRMDTVARYGGEEFILILP
jgi:diguanylate cyclase (GGDEF)-like protein